MNIGRIDTRKIDDDLDAARRRPLVKGVEKMKPQRFGRGPRENFLFGQISADRHQKMGADAEIGHLGDVGKDRVVADLVENGRPQPAVML